MPGHRRPRRQAQASLGGILKGRETIDLGPDWDICTGRGDALGTESDKETRVQSFLPAAKPTGLAEISCVLLSSFGLRLTEVLNPLLLLTTKRFLQIFSQILQKSLRMFQKSSNITEKQIFPPCQPQVY